MGKKFDGKVALVTGAAVGIGRAVALRLAEGGASVAVLDLSGEGAESVAKEAAKFGTKTLAIACDVSDKAAVTAAAERIKAELGEVDILVNNAAIWRVFGRVTDVDEATWNKLWAVNVMGSVHCIRAVLPSMLARGYGRIVNVASVAGVYGNPNMAAYSATKGALISLTMALAKEVANRGVRVNAVSPGTVSDSSDSDLSAFMPDDRQYMERTGSDNENADLICFLAGDEANYLSGQNILIDGVRRVI